MAVGAMRGEHCGPWERGLDCKFNARAFHQILAVIWALMAMGLFGMFVAQQGIRKVATGTAAQCLLLATVSASGCCFDHFLTLVFDDPETEVQEYGYGTLNMLCSILLLFALRAFVNLWVSIASALQHMQLTESSREPTRPLWFWIIRRGYDAMALMNVPFALVAVASVYEWGPDFDKAMMAWSGWCIFSGFAVSSTIALLMFAIVFVHLENVSFVRSLRRITFVHGIQQVLYNVSIVLMVGLYWSTWYDKYGYVQLAFYSVMALMLWLMHWQILLFFIVCDPNNPIYSHREFSSFMEETSSLKSASGTMDPYASGTIDPYQEDSHQGSFVDGGAADHGGDGAAAACMPPTETIGAASSELRDAS